MKDLEDDEREFPIRVYTKVELALLYAPHLSENAALNNLSRWMRHNKLLMAALEEVGYYKYRHSFTPKEVRLIFDIWENREHKIREKRLSKLTTEDTE